MKNDDTNNNVNNKSFNLNSHDVRVAAGKRSAEKRGRDSLSQAGKKGALARSHESRVEGGKKAAITRGYESLSAAGKKGGENSRGKTRRREKVKALEMVNDAEF